MSVAPQSEAPDRLKIDGHPLPGLQILQTRRGHPSQPGASAQWAWTPGVSGGPKALKTR